MRSLKQIARYRLQALATDQYLQGLLHRRRAENLALMGWCPHPCDEDAASEQKEEAPVVAKVVNPPQPSTENSPSPHPAQSPVSCELPRTILVVKQPVVTRKKERKVKTTDKIEMLLIMALLFGVGTAVLLACMSVAILFFSSGAVSAGGGAAPPTVIP